MFDCGFSKPVSCITMESRLGFVRCITLHYVLYRNYAELNQFKDGLLGTLGFKTLVQSHPVEMWSLLSVDKDRKLTAQYIQDLFSVNYSQHGSNKRPLEESIVMFLYDFLQECEGIIIHICVRLVMNDIVYFQYFDILRFSRQH